MKNSKFFKFSILGLLPIIMSIGVVSARKETPTNVDAYDKTGVLTKNLDLNDCTDDEIKSYYSSLSGKSTSELQGNNLLKNLKTILKNGQKYFKYDGDSLWAMYEIIDRDWEKSPASEIAGYKPATNTVENYTYGYSVSGGKGTNPYIHALYVNRDVDNQTRAWDDHQQTQWGINQEHIWPKSQGFNASGAGGARGDPMHLWAGNGRVNGTEHNNNMYGFVDKTKETTDPVTKKGYTNLANNLSGSSLTMPNNTGSYDTVFEPQDSDKGDIARAIFYMVARYNDIAGNDEEISTDNPNLKLVQDTRNLASYTSTSINPGKMGVMTDLLEWNKLDPVDEFEIHRNNLLFRNYTKNRNPFIDYPEWADYIWGTAEYNGRKFVSYNSTPTGSVNLNTDPINGGEQEQEESDSAFKKATSLAIGDKVSIVCETKKVELTSFTTSGTSYGVGTAYSGDINGTMLFDVVAGSKSNSFAFKNGSNYINWSSENTLSLSTSITDNSSWNVTFTDGNASIVNASDSARVIKWNAKSPRFAAYLTSSPQTEIQLYKKDMSNAVTGVSLDANTATVEVGNSIQLTPTISPKNASNKDVTWSSSDSAVASVSDGKITALKAGTTTITVTTVDGSFTATCNVTVKNAPSVVSLAISGDYQKMYELNEEFLIDGMVVTAHLDNGTDIDVTSDVDVSFLDTSTSGVKTITVTYKGISATTNIYVCTSSFILDSTLSLENGAAVSTLTNNGVTLTFNKNGGTQAAYYTAGDSVRLYNRTELVLTSSDRIANISFGFGSGDGSNALTPSVGTFDGVNWEGSAREITFIVGGTSGHRRVNRIFVTTIPNPHIDHIAATGLSKNTYEIGDQLDLSGLTVTAYYTDNTSVVLDSSEYTVTGFDSSTAGNKNLTITYKDSYNTQKTTTVAYKVSAATLTGIALSGNYKKTFEYGSDLDTSGLVVTASYSNSTTDNVTSLVSFSGYSSTTLGEQTITVSYTEGITKTATYKVTVVDYLDRIEISGNKKTDYKYGDQFSKENITVTAYMKSGATKDVTSNTTFTGYNGTSLTTQEITATYTEGNHTATAKYSITVTDKLNGITLSGNYKTQYKYGESFSKEGAVVTANMASGTKDVTANATFSGYSATTLGEQTITVSYTFDGVTKQATYKVTVSNFTKSISLSGNKKTSYLYGEEFDKTGIVVTATLASGTKNVTDNVTFSGYDKTKLGNQTITVTYVEGGEEFKTTYTVSVIDYIKELKIECLYDEYEVDSEFEPSKDLKITAVYAGPTADKTISASKCTISDVDMSTVGDKTVTITYEGVEATLTIRVVEPSVDFGAQILAGCGGSLIASAGIVSLVSALGAGLLLLKKKEN